MRSLVFGLMLLLAPAAMAQETAQVIVQGRGQIAAVPDMATITLRVLREAETAAAALAAVSEATGTVLQRVAGEGIEARDVQTGQLSVQPRWDQTDNGRSPNVTGYVAETALIVRVRDLDRLGALLDAAVADGANGLDGVQFGLSDPEPGERAARQAAVLDAMTKAETLAAAAGLTLGSIVSLIEGQSGSQGPIMMEMAAARSMAIAAGEITQDITVTLTVEMVSD
ncbi:MAG: SIMPL domain-containing protein [Jannaschia sp.]